MSLPASIRINVRAPFPASVSGSAFMTVVKANGAWTVTPDYTVLNTTTPGSLQSTQMVALQDSVSKLWSTISMASLIAAFTNLNYRLVTAAGAVTVGPSDVVILLQKSPSGTSTINLPASSSRSGTPVIVKDLTGDANTNNVTIVPSTGETIDGFSAAAAAVNGVALIDVDYGQKKLYPLTSGGWYVL